MLRVGTRGSKLARTQAATVIDAMRALDPSLNIETVVIATDDDGGVADKSRFVNAIEQALRSQEIDLAIHSAKDVPGVESPGLLIVAVPDRADPRDALCGAESLSNLEEGARVGTSSLRRAAQLRSLRPDLRIEPLRGNVDTRLRHLEKGDFDALVLAAAGLDRLRIDGVVRGHLDECVPAPGQGALALQTRDIDLTTTGIVGPLSNFASFRELTAERAAAAGLVASCNTPIGINAKVEVGAAEGGKDRVTVRGWLGLPDGTRFIEDEVSGLASEGRLLGHLLAQRMRASGGDEILLQAEEMAA